MAESNTKAKSVSTKSTSGRSSSANSNKSAAKKAAEVSRQSKNTKTTAIKSTITKTNLAKTAPTKTTAKSTATSRDSAKAKAVKANTTKTSPVKGGQSKAGAGKASSAKPAKKPSNKVIDSFTLPVNRQKTAATNNDMDWSDLEEQVNDYIPENEDLDQPKKQQTKASVKETFGKPRPERKRKALRIIGGVISAILTVSSIVLGIMIVSINLLPEKYLIPALVALGAIVILFGSLMLTHKVKIAIKIPVFLISIILSAGYIFGIVYLNRTFNFFNSLGDQDYAVEEYYVLVKKDSAYENIHDLAGKTIATFDEQNEVYEQAIKQLNALVKADLNQVSSIGALPTSLTDGVADALLISAVHQDILADENSSFNDTVRSIYTIEVKIKLANVDAAKVDVSTNPFTVYISGIDAYGDISSMKRGRSDVNMLATVNPKTHEVLLVSIPRDYYVQLHGTSGYRDKLTHAGIYGVQMSINTLEDLLDIDIDYYLKVNFSTVTKLVDTIGGIDVYSDQNIRLLHAKDRGVIPKGMVHMDGALALAFARERYGYSTGDRHRVQNQQDVISAIIKKVGSSTVILTKYGEILDDLSDCLTTNLGKDEISGLVKLQLQDMPTWNIAQYSLNGADSHNYTYSMGQQMLYVMEPDMQTVQKAHEYITGILEGKSIAELGISK